MILNKKIMILTSDNDDFCIETLRDCNTYDRRSSSGISHAFGDDIAGTSLQCSLDFTLSFNGI